MNITQEQKFSTFPSTMATRIVLTFLKKSNSKRIAHMYSPNLLSSDLMTSVSSCHLASPAVASGFLEALEKSVCELPEGNYAIWKYPEKQASPCLYDVLDWNTSGT